MSVGEQTTPAVPLASVQCRTDMGILPMSDRLRKTHRQDFWAMPDIQRSPTIRRYAPFHNRTHSGEDGAILRGQIESRRPAIAGSDLQAGLLLILCLKASRDLSNTDIAGTFRHRDGQSLLRSGWQSPENATRASRLQNLSHFAHRSHSKWPGHFALATAGQKPSRC